MRLSFRPTFWPTVFTIPAVLLMLGLGAWQLERLQWKEELIAERTGHIAAAPIPLPGPTEDISKLEYRRVAVEGEFLHGKATFLGARSMNGNPGYHVVTPFRLQGGRVLLADRGWIPLDRKDPRKRGEGEVPGQVRLTALIRLQGRQHVRCLGFDPRRGRRNDFAWRLGLFCQPRVCLRVCRALRHRLCGRGAAAETALHCPASNWLKNPTDPPVTES